MNLLKKNFSVFEVEGVVVEHIMTLSEFKVTSVPTLSFHLDGSIFYFLSQLKIMNSLLKYYSNILLVNLSMITDSLFFKKTGQDNKFNNRSVIADPNTLSYFFPGFL